MSKIYRVKTESIALGQRVYARDKFISHDALGPLADYFLGLGILEEVKHAAVDALQASDARRLRVAS